MMIWNILKKITEAWKGITAIVSIVMVVATATIFLDHQKRQKNDIVNKVDYLIRSDSTGKVNNKIFQDSILSTLHYLRRSYYEQRTEQYIMKNIMIEQFKKTMTKDELVDMFSQFEKKNNGESFFQIAPNRNR